MDLGGTWFAAEANDALRRSFPEPDFDDAGWEPMAVPGHWRSVPAFSHSDGPLIYRRRFEADRAGGGDGGGGGRRRWLTLEGLFYQGDVWLDGSYLGDTEGYFFPHTFEVTSQLAERSEHVLAVEVACHRPTDRRAKRNLTGIFQHWDCIDPDWNPGGIWAPVGVRSTGRVRISALRVLCRDATAERATLDLEAELDAANVLTATIETVISRVPGDGVPPTTTAITHDAEQTLAAGSNRVKWRIAVERPDLWWPHALGEQPLYDVSVVVRLAEGISDQHRATTGLRQVRMNNFITAVNGERLFLKGTNCGPTRRAIAEATPAELAADVAAARDAGLDLIRVHAHITRTELYDTADRLGMLIWQDLPLQWGYSGVRRQALRQARRAVTQLGHHPSVAIWCGHNEPLALDVSAGEGFDARAISRFAVGQFLPSWNKTALDRSVKRALEKSDGSRPVVAHSGILPHPMWGTDTHLYYGWYHGEERDLAGLLARLPILARFLSEFGAQAVPASDDFLEPDRWPDLDWEHLGRAHALQKAIFDRRVPPADYPTLDAWRAATQSYQASLLRHHVETLRRLKYRPTGGFCQFLLADAQPAVSWSVLDHRREPKAGYDALAAACAPVIVVADRPRESYRPGERINVNLHVVSDLRGPVAAVEVTATLRWTGGHRIWRFAGDLAADSCTRIGRLVSVVPDGLPDGSPLDLDLELSWAESSTARAHGGGGEGGQRVQLSRAVTNSYTSVVRAHRR